ncbi:helix-turn-helix domain-containing protein [Leucobacter sp. HY1908]
MSTTIADFARGRGVTVQHARRLARTGKVPAHKGVGGAWVVESASAPKKTRRPLGANTQADLAQFFLTRSLSHATGMRKQRLASVVRQLHQSSNPAALIRDYFDGQALPTAPAGAAVVLAARMHLDEEVRLTISRRPVIHIRSARDFGQRIVDFRILRGVSSEELAVRMGLSAYEVRQIERGTYEAMSPPIAWRIARALDIPVTKMNVSRGL